MLGTKLHLPSPRRRLVPRGCIIDQLRLGGGEGPRLILVAAPPGFGKTTLLAQWLAAEDSQRRVAWLALDAGDADLRVFLTHLVAAIQTAEPEVGVDALALLEARGATPTEAVLVSLINDLDVLAGPTVVTLDDYHAIDEAAGPRSGDVPAGQPASASHARHEHSCRPAAAAVSSACPWRARGGAGGGPQVHHRRGGAVSEGGDGVAAGAGTRGCARGAHGGVGGRAAAGRAVGPGPWWRRRGVGRRRWVRRGFLRKPSICSRLSR